jgi:hypothetical protein
MLSGSCAGLAAVVAADCGVGGDAAGGLLPDAHPPASVTASSHAVRRSNCICILISKRS